MPTKISSLTHPIVKHFFKLRTDATYRKQCKSCLILGKKLTQELENKIQPIYILDNASEAIYKKITGLPHPEPFLAEFPLPQPQRLNHVSSLLVIDQISDPGNLGTLLRTALALSWGGVFFLPNSVDPFNDKVLRSSKAALFHLPYCFGTKESLKELSSNFTTLIADLEGQEIHTLLPIKQPLLILSHEAKGVDRHWEELGKKITIPIKTMESLNVAVAGAIMMYELCKMKN